MPNVDLLSPAWWQFVADARTAVLTTRDPETGFRSVPICCVLLARAPRDLALYSPLDEKPKHHPEPRRLRRVRNLLADPHAGVLVDRWDDEDWDRLAFVDLGVLGSLLEPGGPEHAAAIPALRAKYRQYREHRLEERPMLRLVPTGVRGRWGDPVPRSS